MSPVNLKKTRQFEKQPVQDRLDDRQVKSAYERLEEISSVFEKKRNRDGLVHF